MRTMPAFDSSQFMDAFAAFVADNPLVLLIACGLIAASLWARRLGPLPRGEQAHPLPTEPRPARSWQAPAAKGFERGRVVSMRPRNRRDVA